MSDDKKTNTKSKATGTKVQPGTGARTKADKQPTATPGATDVLTQANTDQAGQGNSEQKAGEKSTELDTQVEKSATGTQGSEVDREIILDELPKVLSNVSDSTKKESKTTTDKRDRIAKEVFAKNAGLKVVYFTSDLVPFGTENDALKHAANLKDNTVIPTKKEA